MKRTPTAAALAAAMTVALGACGTSDTGDAAAASSSEADAVTVVDARGEEIVLDGGPATRVVALEWMEAENLVSLGVMPVGVADVDGYNTWVSAAPLDDTVADVGTRAEPSVEAILELEPDLIVMEDDRDAGLVEQLEEYAPVLVIEGSDASGNLEQLRANLDTIATAVGKEDEAGELLAELDSTIADARAALDAAGLAGQGFAMADGWMEGSTVNIRMFGEGSLMSDLAEAIGLDNRWAGDVDAAWGLGQTDVEGLTALGDVQFFYSASEDDPFADGLATNPIWTSLPFVAAGKVHKLEDGTWTFGGPASARQFVDQVVAALVS